MPAHYPETNAAQADSRRIPTLDGLRAIACLAVFGVHWQQFTGFAASWGPFDAKRFLENGNTGVSLFFTLSAFLLSLHFWAGRWGQRDRPWVRDYIFSRAVRILPAYYLCLGALVVLDQHFLNPQDRLDTTLHVMLVHNLREANFYGLNPPFWTIAVQAQAYVVLPLVILLTMRVSSSWKIRATLLTALVVASYVIHWASLSWPPGHGIANWAASRPTVATDSLLAHAPHFVLGLLAGLLYLRCGTNSVFPAKPDRYAAAREISVWLAAVVIFAIISTRLDDWFTVPFGRYNFPVVPVLIAWVIIQAPRTRLARLALDAAPLRLLGLISYGVYVFHYPALRFVGRGMRLLDLSVSDHWALFGLASLAVTVVIAGLSFAVIETPILRLAKAKPRHVLSAEPRPARS